MTVCLAALVSFAVTLVAGKFLLDALRRLHAGQEIRADGPKWHASKAGTPTMGGLMFILGSGVAAAALGAPLLARGMFLHLHLFAFALLFGAVGFVDDWQKVRHHRNEGLTARQKLLLQLAAAVVFLTIMRHDGHLSNALYLPWIDRTIALNWYVYLVFAAFVIVGCVNSVNLTDGVDGLAGSVTLAVCVFFAAAGAVLGASGDGGLFAAALAGGLAAFLVYNHHPAKVFMGDTGSLFLGGAVAALAFAIDLPLILVPVGVVYIAETLSDIIQVTYFKATHGKRIFKMAPLHHHLELSGWSEGKLVSVFTAVTTAGCLLAWLALRTRYGA